MKNCANSWVCKPAPSIIVFKTGLLLDGLFIRGHTVDNTQVQRPMKTQWSSGSAIQSTSYLEAIQAKLAQAHIPTGIAMSMVVQLLTDNPASAASSAPQTTLFSYNVDVPRTLHLRRN